MLLDPQTLELSGCAPQVIERLGGDPRFKLELPRSQLEIVTAPASTVAHAARQLYAGRQSLVRVTEGLARPAAAAVHPFSPGRGELNSLGRYRATIAEYGLLARRQLVCASQVHVAVGGADRALAVYNAARRYLPLVAALAAHGAFYEGCDTGLASVRPKLCELLPRQGVPPMIASWEEYAAALEWGARGGWFDPGRWWWELRLHPCYGTLEFRVPDAQATVGEIAAVAALVQSLIAWLADRHDGGEASPSVAGWQLEENRWSACRHGVQGTMADLDTGAPRATRELLHELFTELEPVAERLGAASALDGARRLAVANGAIVQREVARDGGARAVAASLAERFLEGLPG